MLKLQFNWDNWLFCHLSDFHSSNVLFALVKRSKVLKCVAAVTVDTDRGRYITEAHQ